MPGISLHPAVQGQVPGLIPPGSTTFHLLLTVHIAAGLTCVVTGAVAALSPKRPVDGGNGIAGAGSACTSPA